MATSAEIKAEEANAGMVRERECSLAPLPEKPLTALEKRFLLIVERGDCASVRKHLQEYSNNPEVFDINCKDPLMRTGLMSAIENENYDMIVLLLEAGIKVEDALLHAIKEEYVEGVEILLDHEERIHKPGAPYSWEAIDRAQATFTPDITPLILAAHMNNYEIIKILLDRGATLPMPHDVRCGCDDCISAKDNDSLRHSQARINAYRALSSPSLISLSSRDPILTAFELSWELRSLARMENEFSDEYKEMRNQVQQFATSLLDHARTSAELDTILNHDPDGEGWDIGEKSKLERLQLAIDYRQKAFVAHRSVQQLLTTMWYDGLPGFRRLGIVAQLMKVLTMAATFPINSMICKLSPNSKKAKLMEKPFVKFINHCASYMFFLLLLGAVSQRVEYLFMEIFGNKWMHEILRDWKRRERGSFPGLFESGVIIYVFSLMYSEIQSLWKNGPLEYISNAWNIIDFISNTFYSTWISLRFTSMFIAWREAKNGWDPHYPREEWDPFDPMLLSEGMFAAAMIFSFLKLVHIFSVNPHLGPLQISLGRMIIDIIKFFFIYTLVLFAFGCGMNKLLWYYADLEMRKCYHLPSGLADFVNEDMACTIWRRFSNLFETSQSLFWASFGMVDLMAFEMTGVKSFTRFWALLMFGSYSVINVIVLLNMLIAMMSNSYQIISEHSDMEWKFARSKLWMSYFEEGDAVPPPFNMMPGVNTLKNLFGANEKRRPSVMARSYDRAMERHDIVSRLLIRRYVTNEQRKSDDFGITEDDVTEIRQDINTLRYELVDILKNNGMNTPNLDKSENIAGKKKRVMERRLKQDFRIDCIEGVVNAAIIGDNKVGSDMFSRIAKAIGNKRKSTLRSAPVKGESVKKDWNSIVKRDGSIHDPIGSIKIRERRRSSQHNTGRQLVSPAELEMEKLMEERPTLKDVTPAARVAFVKFRTRKVKRQQEQHDQFTEEEGHEKHDEDSDKPAISQFVYSFKSNRSIKDVACRVQSTTIDESKTHDTNDKSHDENNKPTECSAKSSVAPEEPKSVSEKKDETKSVAGADNINQNKSIDADKMKTSIDKPKLSNERAPSLPPPPESRNRRRRSSPRPSVAPDPTDAASKQDAPPKVKKQAPLEPEQIQHSSILQGDKGKSKVSGKMIEGWI